MTSEVREAATFIARHQAKPESHMSNIGIEEAVIVSELTEFETQLFVDRDETGKILGVTGVDYDEELNRGFLYGPWSTSNGWDERADVLLGRAIEALPARTETLEGAFNMRNRRAQAFCDRHGFELVRDHFMMGFARDSRALRADPDIREMTDDDRDAVMALHGRCFEAAWPSPRQLMEQLEKGENRVIFVLYLDDDLAGYHYAVVDDENGEAYVENIGVDERFRTRGIATRLLVHGLWWMYGFESVRNIELMVREENAPAIRVYEKAGFRKLHAIRQVRKPLSSAPLG